MRFSKTGGYNELMKEEFVGTLSKLLQDRRFFSIYYIDLLCSSATIVGYDYRYEKGAGIVKTIILGENGHISFKIDPETDYATIVSDNYKEIVNDTLSNLTVK